MPSFNKRAVVAVVVGCAALVCALVVFWLLRGGAWARSSSEPPPQATQPPTVGPGQSPDTADSVASILRGTVVDTAWEEPLSNAVVTVLAEDRLDSVRTDARGSFDIDVPGLPVTVRAECVGYEAASLVADVADSLVVIRLRRASSDRGLAYGYVVDDDNFFIAGATVVVSDPMGAVVASTATDARGRFEFRDYAPKEWEPGYRVIVPGGARWETQEERLATASEYLWVSVRSRPADPVVIRVVFGDSALALHGETVSILLYGRNPRRLRSAVKKLRHGAVEFGGMLPGQYTCAARIGSMVMMQSIDAVPPLTTVTIDEAHMALGGTVLAVVSGQPPHDRIAGRLVLAAHAALGTSVDATSDEYTIATSEDIKAWPLNRFEIRGRYDESSGAMRFDAVPAGDYQLVIATRWCDPMRVPVTVDAGSGTTTIGRLQLVPASGRLRVSLEFRMGLEERSHAVRAFSLDGVMLEESLEPGQAVAEWADVPCGRYAVYVRSMFAPEDVVDVVGVTNTPDGLRVGSDTPVCVNVSRAPIVHGDVRTGMVSTVTVTVDE